MADLVIRLDKSKNFSTCHGDRTPEDPLYRVVAWQGGWMTVKGKKIQVLLPFDVHGELVPDDGKTEPFTGMGPDGKPTIYRPLYDANMREFIKARATRHAALAAAAATNLAGDGPVIEPDEQEDDAPVVATHDDVDFAAWLRGQAKYPPRLLREAALKRFSLHYGNLSDLIVDCVEDHKIISAAELAPEFQPLLRKAFMTDTSVAQVAANAPVVDRRAAAEAQ